MEFQIGWVGEEQLCSASGQRWTLLREYRPGVVGLLFRRDREGGGETLVRTGSARGASRYRQVEIRVSGQPSGARWVRTSS